ncbi:MAG: TetR family transcriptional regulator C-terminal domain-containing protein, partial [Pseudomonas sp.]
DFATQICQVTGRSRLTKQDMEDASSNLIHIILKGCGIKPSA